MQTHGLTLGHATVVVTGLNGIGYVHVSGSLLDEVTVHYLVQIHDINVILDNLNTYLARHGGIVPLERYLTAARGIFGTQVGHSLTGVHRFQINI